MPIPPSHGFLKELDKKPWTAADRLLANPDAAVYKHAVLGLIFLKYVSDSFTVSQREIEAQLRDPASGYFLDPAMGSGGFFVQSERLGQGHTRGQTSLLTFESYFNQSVIALRANPGFSSDQFLFFDLARRYGECRQLSDSHSSRGSLTTKLLAGVRSVLSSRELIEAFDKPAASLVRQIAKNLHQSRPLAALRDTLLPKLPSGELRIRDSLGASEAVQSSTAISA